MKARLPLLLAVLCAAGALVVAYAIEDTVPVPVHEPGTASGGCCCDGETEGCTGDCETCPECTCEDGDCCCGGGTEGCTGDCDDCEAEASCGEGCHGGSPHGHHCGGCH